MKRTRWIATVFAAAALAAVPAASQVVEEIVAIVNDDIITLSEYRAEWQTLSAALRAQIEGESLDKELARVKSELLEMMITDILLLQRARALNLNVSEQITQTIDNIKTQNNFQSDEELRRALQQQGMTYEQFRGQLEENILKQALLYSEVDRTIVLDDAQIVQYYKEHPDEFTIPTEYTLRAVYLSPDGRSAEDLEALRTEVSGKLAGGADFAALAGEYSSSPLKESQGDLGKFTTGELDKALEEAVSGLKAGDVAPWVQTANGWYLLKLEARTDAHLQPFEAVKKQVEEKLFYERQGKKRQEFIEKMRKDSYVNILKPDPSGLLDG